MKVHSIAILFLLTTACCLSAQPGLPANPDPDKCYTRLIAPAEYEVYYEDHLTYSREEARGFSCEIIEVEVKPARSGWEYLAADNAVYVDGLVRCRRNYAAVYDTIFQPANDSLGNPLFKEYVFHDLVKAEGDLEWVEIDCSLSSPQEIDLDFIGEDQQLSEASRQLIDDVMLYYLQSEPKLTIIVGSHRRIMGDQQSSLTITKQRAQRISNYLVSQGVSSERIIPLGYGESTPKYHCGRGARCTETLHAENERIVFWVPDI